MILKVIEKMTKNLVIMNVIMKSEDVMRIWLLKFNNHCLCSDCRNLNKILIDHEGDCGTGVGVGEIERVTNPLPC